MAADQQQSDHHATGVRDALRAVLASVEAGDLPAEPTQVAFLRGAIAALEAVLGGGDVLQAVSQSHGSETGDGQAA